MREPALPAVSPGPLIERMAKAGYEEIVRQTKDLETDAPTWESQTEEIREEYLGLARAMQRSLPDSKSPREAKGQGRGRRGAVMPLMVCAVLGFVVGFATASWIAGWGGYPRLAAVDRASPAVSGAAPIEPTVQPPATETTTPIQPEPEVNVPRDVPAQEPAAAPSTPPMETANAERPARTADKTEPRSAPCAADLEPWPVDSKGQGKAIQTLLRDLGFYSGATTGTVGPVTRAAIRKFQLAANEPGTGEPSKMLFELLKKKKCASMVP